MKNQNWRNSFCPDLKSQNKDKVTLKKNENSFDYSLT